MHKRECVNYDGFILEMVRETNSDSPLKTAFFAFVAQVKSTVGKINRKKTGGSSAGTDSHGH